MKKKYITLIRVLSMVSVVIGHLLSSSDISLIKSLGQFCYIGVMLFFYISGFLYGTKKLKENFIHNRLIKIFLPELVFSIIILVLYLSVNHINQTSFIKYLFIYFLNIQYFFDYLSGIGHLWFISIIMVCYLFTFILEDKNNKSLIFIICMLFIASIVLLLINQKISQFIMYLVTYTIGYFHGKNEFKKKKENNRIIINCLLFVFSISIRMILRNYFDNTAFYNIFIVSISNFICGIAIFNTLKNTVKNTSEPSYIMSFLDNYCYYIYLVHYIFVIGPFSLISTTDNYVLNCLIIGAISMILACIYKNIYEKTICIIKRWKEKKNGQYDG